MGGVVWIWVRIGYMDGHGDGDCVGLVGDRCGGWGE